MTRTYHSREDFVKTAGLFLLDILGNKDLPEGLVARNTVSVEFGKPNILRILMSRLSKRPLDYYSKILCEILSLRDRIKSELNTEGGGGIKFLVRVDDFPRWNLPSDRYFPFHEIFERYQIPYLLGITPFLSLRPNDPSCREFRNLNPEELRFLKRIHSEGCEFALHGFTHQVKDRRQKTELIGMTDQEVKSKVEECMEYLKGEGLEVNVFIPPFNSIDSRYFKILKHYFKIITGGPESIKLMGYTITPVFIEGGIYLPSYSPLYGYAYQMVDYVKGLNRLTEDFFVPITLHWSWEYKSGYKWLDRLLSQLKGRVSPWSKMINLKEVLS